jgi:hypothetical protein
MRALDAIDDWRRAYEAANGKPPPSIYYQAGWFHIVYEERPSFFKHRRASLEAMTARLRATAEQREKQK